MAYRNGKCRKPLPKKARRIEHYVDGMKWIRNALPPEAYDCPEAKARVTAEINGYVQRPPHAPDGYDFAQLQRMGLIGLYEKVNE